VIVSWPAATAAATKVSDSPQLDESVSAVFWLAALKNPSAAGGEQTGAAAPTQG
jgi:hypothetical protein